MANVITTRIVDGQSGDAIRGCVVRTVGAKGKIIANIESGREGVVRFSEASLDGADSVRFIHYAYMPLAVAVSEIGATIRLAPNVKSLGEITVMAERKTVSQNLNAITYDVSLDLAVRDKSLWEAVGRTPFVVTSPNGSISTIPGYNGIEYRINGLEDAILKNGNYQNVFSSIPAKHISRIEVKEVFTSDGTKLQLNIVTKGRIEGVTGSVTSMLNDDSWYNGVYMLTKIKRLTFSLSYANSWLWGHTSTDRSIETRSDNELLPRFEKTAKDHGFRTDVHTPELSASYDLSNSTVLSVYGTLWGKSNPHTKYSGDGRTFSTGGREMMEYTYSGLSKAMKDLEYFIGTSLQHSFRTKGYVTATYQFYGRDSRRDRTMDYDIECAPELADDYHNLFPNYKNWVSSRLRTHTFNAKLYKPLKHSDEITVEARGRYYINKDANSDTYFYSGGSDIETGHFKHRQLNGYLRGEYYRELGRKFSFDVAAHMYIYDNKMYQDEHGFNNTVFNFAPSAYFTFMPGNKSRLNLSYEMSKLVPSVTALDPYKDYTSPGTVRYGNPGLDPETRHQVNLRLSFFLGRSTLQFTSANRFSNDLMLETQFLDGGLLNRTYANAASRIESSFSAFFQRRHNKHLFFRLFTSANYVNYNTYSHIEGIGRGCNGWYWNNQAYISYDFDSGWSLSARASAHTRYIYLQGKGNADYTYGINVSKYFLNNRLIVSAFCNNPLPVHKTIYSELASDGYFRRNYRHNYTASFGFSIQYRFGNLRANVKGAQDQIGTSDIKNSYSE